MNWWPSRLLLAAITLEKLHFFTWYIFSSLCTQNPWKWENRISIKKKKKCIIYMWYHAWIFSLDWKMYHEKMVQRQKKILINSYTCRMIILMRSTIRYIFKSILKSWLLIFWWKSAVVLRFSDSEQREKCFRFTKIFVYFFYKQILMLKNVDMVKATKQVHMLSGQYCVFLLNFKTKDNW